MNNRLPRRISNGPMRPLRPFDANRDTSVDQPGLLGLPSAAERISLEVGDNGLPRRQYIELVAPKADSSRPYGGVILE